MSGYLCEELTLEIFTRLPTKSLLRFRSLSKSSYSIISSPDFIRMHAYQSPKKLLIRHRNYKSEDFFTLHSEDQLPLSLIRVYYGIKLVRYFPYHKKFDIVGSCNGILCFYDNKHSICLWNPSIRRKLTVPYCPQRCNSRVHIGFGFDPITNDYKIVRVPNSIYGVDKKSSFVYSMKTGTWCEITSPTPYHCHHSNSKAVVVNGKLHWLVVNYVASPENETAFYIMTFDLSSHVFGMIALLDLSWRSIQLTIIQGSLAVISKLGDSSIWVRTDASWSVLLESKGTQVEGTIMNVLQTSSNGNLLIQTYYEGFKVYNLKLGYVQSRLVDFTAASLHMVDMEMCSESLQLLDMGTTLEGY